MGVQIPPSAPSISVTQPNTQGEPTPAGSGLPGCSPRRAPALPAASRPSEAPPARPSHERLLQHPRDRLPPRPATSRHRPRALSAPCRQSTFTEVLTARDRRDRRGEDGAGLRRPCGRCGRGIRTAGRPASCAVPTHSRHARQRLNARRGRGRPRVPDDTTDTADKPPALGAALRARRAREGGPGADDDDNVHATPVPRPPPCMRWSPSWSHENR